MKRYYGGVISGSTSITGAGLLTPTTVQLAPAASTIMDATGGTITYSGNYKIHTFLTSGTFTVTAGKNYVVEYLAVGAGGGGGQGSSTAGANGGGGGGGGFLEYYAGVTEGADFVGPRVTVNAGDVITVTVGGMTTKGQTGASSKIELASKFYVEALGGGYGCQGSASGASGGGGASSGGSSLVGQAAYAVIRPRQGYAAAGSVLRASGAGGVAISAAVGAGRTSYITGGTYGQGGNVNTASNTDGAANSGNGGGGTQGTPGTANVAGKGGSGIVVIRYLYQ